MTRRLLAFTAALSLLLLFGTQSLWSAQGDNPNKPAKATWSPSKIGNANLEEEGFFVVLSVDKDIFDAELWVSGSLTGLLEWPTESFDLLKGETIEIPFTLLQTPDEVGHTIGGTVHLRAGGKNLAKPLTLSLKKTIEDDPGGEGGEEAEDEDGIVDEEGNLPITWSIGEEDAQEEVRSITPDLFDEEGFAEVRLTANRDLADVLLWLTPSLRDCVLAYFPPAEELPIEDGVLEVNEDGSLAFIAQGVEVPVVLELLKPLDELDQAPGGTLHLRGADKPKRTWPAVLGFALGESVEEEPEEEVAPSAIVDAANYELGPIAPNQIVSIFGLGIAPEDLDIFQLEDGVVPEDLAGVIVLIDGYPASLLAAGRGQINAVVPGHVKGHHADIVVINQGKSSAPFPVELKKIVPKVFTALGSGTGQVAAVNPSGVLNGGASPVSDGGILSFWVTGVGLTNPAVPAGEVADGAYPLVEPVQVSVGGVDAEVLYAGTAPGMIGAVIQVNIRIGEGTPSGPQPIEIVIGDEEGPDTTTIEVE